MSVTLARTLAVAATAATVVGCAQPAGFRAVERRELRGERAERHAALIAEARSHWERRSQPSEALAAIDAWERAVDLKPDDWRTFMELSRAALFYADGWLRADGPRDELLAVLERGIGFAELGLAAYSPELERRLATEVPLEDAISVVGSDGIGLVFWYTANLGTWASYQGLTTGLSYKDTILELALHLHAHAPDYYHGAADRLLGAYYAAVPAFAGGDLARSREHFERSLARGPNYLGTYVLFAELYATAADDAPLFERSLRQVLSAQPCERAPGARPCIQPDIAAEAAVAQRRAAALQRRRHALFSGADDPIAAPRPAPGAAAKQPIPR